MPRILDYTGREAVRTVTVADIVGLKGSGQQLAQVTASTAAEGAAAEAAGIEMVVCMSDFVPAVRAGSQQVFLTAAIDFSGAITEDDILRDALKALAAGADAVITARGLDSVRRLAHEDIPVMGHLGFVPKKSTLYGGVRAVGRTAPEALALWQKFQALEDAGAFAVECELIPAEVLREINARTGLATISLGSGPHADVQFLFTSDICGESERKPRHARAYADLAALQRQIDAERVRALTEFRADVASGGFPSEAEVSKVDAAELAAFVATLEEKQG
ncbi:MAG: 3-methyl-2-oxobutanoate hydroxymethyltransferase [Candidatus Nanopelagicales bacterium]